MQPERRDETDHGEQSRWWGITALLSLLSIPAIIVWEMDIIEDLIAFTGNFPQYNSPCPSPSKPDETPAAKMRKAV